MDSDFSPEEKLKGLTSAFLRELDLFPVVVGPGNRIQVVSRGLLETLKYDKSALQNSTILKLVGIEVFQDLFLKRKDWQEPFKNYRAYIRTGDGETLLFQISGFQKTQSDGTAYKYLLFQNIHAPHYELSTGYFDVSLKANQIIKKYVSRHLAHRAKKAGEAGLDHIPDERREFTFLFADLVSYTEMAEKTSPEEVLDLLNTSIGAASSTILHNKGYVDKIMGDSIFAVFENPANALFSAIEMQKQFNFLNLFRIRAGEPEINIRIGIHTGTCILGSIGGEDFRELTFIGDAVNTASRLEQAARPGGILVSEYTANTAGQHAEWIESVHLHAKGKAEELHAKYLNRISVVRNDGKKLSIGLDDELF